MKFYHYFTVFFALAISAPAINAMDNSDLLEKAVVGINKAENVCSSRFLRSMIPAPICGFVGAGKHELDEIKAEYDKLSETDKANSKAFAKYLLATDAGKKLHLPSFTCNSESGKYECRFDEKQKDAFIRHGAKIAHEVSGFFNNCVSNEANGTSYCAAQSLYMMEKFEKGKGWKKTNK